MSAAGSESSTCKGPGEETAGQVQGTWSPVLEVVMWERGQHVGPNLMVILGSVMCREMGNNWSSVPAGFLASRAGEGVWRQANPWAWAPHLPLPGQAVDEKLP